MKTFFPSFRRESTKKDNSIIETCENNSSLSLLQLRQEKKGPISKFPLLQSNNQSEYSNLNNSDLLSISKTESSISINSLQIIKQQGKDPSSNLLVSFSNISEAEPKCENISNLSNSNTNQNDKETSLTPSTLCNYYLHSNDNTPCSKEKESTNNNTNIYQCNLNVIYNGLNSEKSSSAKSKKTPIKYTKSQFKTNNECNNTKRNLMTLFDESNSKNKNENNDDIFSNLEIKEMKNNDNIGNNMENFQIEFNSKKNILNNFKIENIQTIEFINNKEENDVRNSPNFSFDMTKNIISVIEQKANKTIEDNDYKSPTFKEVACPIQIYNNKNEDNNKKLSKDVSISSLYSFSNNINNININRVKNSSKKRIKSLSKEKSTSKKKNNYSVSSKLYNIIRNQLNIFKKKSRTLSKKCNTPTTSKTSKEVTKSNSKLKTRTNVPLTNNKQSTQTIAIIHNLKPLAFFGKDETKINIKDIMKVKPQYNPLNAVKGKSNKKKSTSLTRKRKIISVSPKQQSLQSNISNSNNTTIETNLTHNPNKGISNSNFSFSKNINSIPANSKVQVIQNFSRYKKKSVINNQQNNNHKDDNIFQKRHIMITHKTYSNNFNKPIMSKKVNKVGGDCEPDFEIEGC